MIKITGLWTQTSQKDGSKYMSGKFGVAKLFLFKNKNKRDNKDPDYNLYVEEAKERPQATAAPTLEEDGF